MSDLTVAGLIEKLKTLPQDARIWIDFSPGYYLDDDGIEVRDGEVSVG